MHFSFHDNQKNYFRHKNFHLFVFVLFAVFSVGQVSVSAAAVKEGSIEFYTDAPSSFDEVIMVFVSDEEFTEQYIYELYSVNNYEGVLSVPFGTYYIDVSIVSTGANSGKYEIESPSNKVTVDSDYLAVPFSIHISSSDESDNDDSEEKDNFGDMTFQGDSSSDNKSDYEYLPTDDDTDCPGSDIEELHVSDEAVSDTQAGAKQDRGSGSLILSLLVSLIFLIGGAILYFIIKHREQN